MVRDKDQVMRFNNAELNLFKVLFADNENDLFTIRKVLLQFDLTPVERKIVKDMMNETVFALISKTFLPELDPEAPLFQLTDMHMGLNVDLKGIPPMDASIFIQIKELEIDYMKQQLEQLRDVDKVVEKDISLKDLANPNMKDKTTSYIEIMARNYLLSYIDSNLQQIKFLAGKKEESVEETVKRLKKDSSK